MTGAPVDMHKETVVSCVRIMAGGRARQENDDRPEGVPDLADGVHSCRRGLLAAGVEYLE